MDDSVLQIFADAVAGEQERLDSNKDGMKDEWK
jgi:hypothetical protein